MRKKKNNYKIIYILGPGHSGSTLIDMVVGSTRQAFSMGELAFYSHYINRSPHVKIDKLGGFKCACGREVVGCPFWRSVKKEVRIKWPIIKNRGYVGTFKIFLNILNPFENLFRFPVRISRNKEVLDAVYTKAKSGKKDLVYLIDSSKDPRRLYELLNDPKTKDLEIFVLYLVRDGRAYVNSFRKDILNINGLKDRSIFITMLEWIGAHIACRRMLSKYKLPHIMIKYHEFTQNPEKHFQKIFEFLGVDSGYEVSKVLQDVAKTKHHLLHGNPMKFKKIDRIFCDLSWKKELTLLQKIASSIVLSPFNALWVFNER